MQPKTPSSSPMMSYQSVLSATTEGMFLTRSRYSTVGEVAASGVSA